MSKDQQLRPSGSSFFLGKIMATLKEFTDELESLLTKYDTVLQENVGKGKLWTWYVLSNGWIAELTQNKLPVRETTLLPSQSITVRAADSDLKIEAGWTEFTQDD